MTGEADPTVYDSMLTQEGFADLHESTFDFTLALVGTYLQTFPGIGVLWPIDRILRIASPNYTPKLSFVDGSVSGNAFQRAVEKAYDAIRLYPPGYFYVCAHGNHRGPSASTGDTIRPSELAKMIRAQSGYRAGKPVVIVACNVGQGPYPQFLANLLNAGVIATPDYASQLLHPLGAVPITADFKYGFPRCRWWRWQPRRYDDWVRQRVGPNASFIRDR